MDNPKEARVYFGCENAQKDRYGQGFWDAQKKNGNAVCGVERPKVDKWVFGPKNRDKQYGKEPGMDRNKRRVNYVTGAGRTGAYGMCQSRLNR